MPHLDTKTIVLYKYLEEVTVMIWQQNLSRIGGLVAWGFYELLDCTCFWLQRDQVHLPVVGRCPF